jgi:Ca2+-transporting ATPase
MLPVQIVFLELIIDPVCSIAFESQPAEPGVMRRSPRAGGAVFFSGPFFRTSLMYGLLLLCAALGVYFVSLFWGVGGAVARSGAFVTLVVGNLLLISSLLSFSQPFYAVVFKNKTAVLFFSAALGLLILVFSFSFLKDIFKITALPGRVVLLGVAACSLFILAVEAIKKNRYNKKSRAES